MATSLWKRLAGFAPLVLTAACNSPTLPLPPPEAPEEVVVSADAKSAELAGAGAQPGALVLVFNDEPTVLAGAIVTADGQGQYRMTVPIDLAANGVNQLELWQRVGTTDSSLISFFIPSRGVRGTPSTAPEGGAGDSDGGVDDAASGLDR